MSLSAILPLLLAANPSVVSLDVAAGALVAPSEQGGTGLNVALRLGWNIWGPIAVELEARHAAFGASRGMGTIAGSVRLTPFSSIPAGVIIGGAAMGAGPGAAVRPAFAYGLYGQKSIFDGIAVRADVRHSAAFGAEFSTHNIEILTALSFTLI